MNINLNANCNWNCVFCQRNHFLETHPAIKGPSMEEVKELIVKEKPSSVIFTGGGEPTMCKDLAELIRMARAAGVNHIGVETNGCKFKDLKYMKRLKDAGMSFLVVSVYSHNPETFDRITQAKASFQAVDACLKNAIKSGITISSVICTITSYNLNELKETVDYVKQFGVRNICFGFIRPYDNSELSRKVTPKLKDAAPYIKEALKYAKANELSATIGAGTDVPLCFLDGYEEYSNSAYLIISSKEKDELHLGDRTRVSACSLCSLRDICPGPNTTYVALHGEKEFIPSRKSKVDIEKKILQKGVG